VREARNRIEFLDRVYMATGINVEVIEGTEVNRLTFLGIGPLLGKNAELRKHRLLVVEVGGGSTEMLGLDDGRVSFAHTFRMGSYRLRETMDARQGPDGRRHEVLAAEIDAGVRQCREAVGPGGGEVALLLMGGEARLAARLLLDAWNESTVARLKVAALAKLAESVLALDDEQIARQYHLSYEEAQTLGPALLIYVRMAKEFRLKQVGICGTTLRDGLLSEAALGNAWADDFVGQILHSVREIGRKYHLDQAHADCVEGNARTLFYALAKEHGLDSRHEVVLAVAAQLHDVGMFIGASSHHKHSQYLIQHSDIFGLGQKDIKLAALVARYHRRASPRPNHSDYAALGRDDRLVVNKLAALLRVADALDRAHTQGLRAIKVVPEQEQVLIEAGSPGDFAAEKRALIEKGEMFEQVYGRPAVLRTKRKQG